jgi:hypothetical protein
MEVKISQTLLVEAANKLSRFLDNGGSPILVSTKSDEKGAVITAPDYTLNEGNASFVETLTLMLIVLINHANEESTQLADYQKYQPFLKYFSGSVEKEVTKDVTPFEAASLDEGDDIEEKQ